jgi:CRP/FNR family transcriptional regulator, cyclic AMP receptor protein
MQEQSTVTVSSFWSNLFKTPAERDEIKEVLNTMLPFKDLSSKELDLLLTIIHNRVYAANEFVFRQGDPGIGLYIIQSGEVAIERKLDEEHKYILTKCVRGDFFGELALLDDEERSASAIATKDSKLAVIFKPDLDAFIDKYPKKGIKILRGLSQIVTTRLRNVNQDFVTLYFQSLNTMKKD